MKYSIVASILAVLVVCAAALAVAQDKSDESAGGANEDGVILRGEKIGDSPVVAMETVVKDPSKYEDKKIVLEGRIGTVCQKKGCWMTLEPVEGFQPVRVTFHNYGFFVPKDAAGLKVRAEGKIKVTTLSKEDVEHLKEDGHKINCKHDGTADEVGFVATAVEIYKKSE
jgi:hypothetical protein